MSRTKKQPKKQKTTRAKTTTQLHAYPPYPERYIPNQVAGEILSTRQVTLSEKDMATLEAGITARLNDLMRQFETAYDPFCGQKSFHTERDPFAAVDCFLACHEANRYPPPEIMEFLADGFYRYRQEWQRGNISPSLDRCFQMKGRRGGKGPKNSWDRQAKEKVYMSMAWEMRVWKEQLKVSPKKYLSIMAAHHHMAFGTLEKLNKQRAKTPEWQGANRVVRGQWNEKFLDQQLKNFISRYPYSLISNVEKYGLPERIRCLHVSYAKEAKPTLENF